MAKHIDLRPRRVIAIALVAMILLSLVPALPSYWQGETGPGFLPDGNALAEECVTSCESFDKLVESWSIVQSRHDAVISAANETGVPANLLKAIMKLESNGLNLLPNGASAVGPMQVTINNWGWWAQTNGLNLYNAEQNIMAGAKILDRFRLQYLDWSHDHGIDPWLTALYAYYAGNPYNLLARDSPAAGGSGITTQEYGARIWFSYQFLQDNWAAIAQATIQNHADIRANAGSNPARATDGDINTTWAVTGQGAPPPGAYVQIDLGEPTRVFEISWVFRTTGYADRLRIRISEDGVNYETIHVTGNAPARAWQYLMLDRAARYVRFNFDNPNSDMTIGYLAEVAVRGVKASEYVEPPLPAVTLDLPASGGSAGATHTSRIRDGKLNTSWYTTGAEYPASGFVYVDLGHETDIREVGWVFSKSSGAPLLEIQISNDKRSWQTIGTAGNAPADEWQRLSVVATGRYVRWLVTNTTGARQIGYIAEVEIRQGGIGNAPIPTPTAEPTVTAHELPGSGGSAGATWTGRIRDGKLDTAWYTTGAPQPASGFVYIDLGSEQAIGGIEWVFSQSGGAPYLEVQTSSDKNVWTTVATGGNAAAGQWQHADVAVTARYVRWLIVNTTGVEQIGYIAEVRVLASAAATPTPTVIASPTAEPTATTPTVDSSLLPAGTPLTVVTLTDSAGGAPLQAIDGSSATVWQLPAGPAWLQADLGADFQITHVAWLPVDAACSAGITIDVSVDGATPLASAGFPTATPLAWQVTEIATTGRFVRWTVTGGAQAAGCIAEIAIFGSATSTPTPEASATTEPTGEAEGSPTTEPVETPTSEPTLEPTAESTTEPTLEPTIEPTVVPTVAPTLEPTVPPTITPEPEPSIEGSEGG